MNTDLISIIIPAYNGERFIDDAIQSARHQTYTNIEIIIYNDGSQDKTEQIVQSINDKRIRYFYSPNEGLVKTLNKAIGKAKGEYICWLNQDDIFLPQKVEKQREVFKHNPNCGASFSYKTDINEMGKPITVSNPSKFCVQKREEVLLLLFQGCFLSAPTVMIKKEVLKKTGPFNEGMVISFDFDMWFRIIKYYDIKILPTALLQFRHHANNLSSEKTGPPLALLESCAAVLDAINSFTIEELFPELCKEFSVTLEKDNDYCQAYLTWALYLFDNTWWRPYLLLPIFNLVLKSLRYNPYRVDSYKLAVQICGEAGLTKQKIYYEKALKDLIKHFYTLLDTLEDSIKKRNKEGLQATLNTLFSLYPEHQDIFFRLHSVFHEMGNEEEADYYLQLIQKGKKDE